MYGRPSCTVHLFRSRVVIMTTLDHAVEEECRRILLDDDDDDDEEEEEEEEEEYISFGEGGGINFMFSCLLLKWRFIWSLLVNLILHSGHVDIS